jgi:hypothetical protein
MHPALEPPSLTSYAAVYCFKKALFLIEAINIRFGTMSPPPFPVPATEHIPVFTDNVLPSLLIHLGVIDLSTASSELSQIFPGAGSPAQLSELLALPPPDVSPSADGKEKKKEPPEEGPVLTNEQAYILRAAAIDACELIVAHVHSLTGDAHPEWVKEIQLPELDMWIWAVAKDRADYRKLKRFVLRDTVFF